jgi:multicomponent Na+:H+ antiporter subunit D
MIVGTALLGTTVLLLSLFPSAVLDGVVAPAARALVDRAGYMAAVLGGI